MGVRAFGTQLLCEQVVGRALRRINYELDENGLFKPEYADIFGIPFDFTGEAVVAPPQPRPDLIVVKSVSPERYQLAISFPRVSSYRPDTSIGAIEYEFTEDSKMTLDPRDLGPSETINAGIAGEATEINLDRFNEVNRENTVVLTLVERLFRRYFREADKPFDFRYISKLKPIVSEWINNYLFCMKGATVAQVLNPKVTEAAVEKIYNGILRMNVSKNRDPIAILDPYNPEGSTMHVRFMTSKPIRVATDPNKCHINYVIGDSKMEARFVKIIEDHPLVVSYVKNQGLGFEVPYTFENEQHRYLPDFIIRIDDGMGKDEFDLINLIIETKGYRGEHAKAKAETMKNLWIPGVNRLKSYGYWAFAEVLDYDGMGREFASIVEKVCEVRQNGKG